MPFEDDYVSDDELEQESSKKSGLKLNNKNSAVSALPKKPNPELFEKQAKEAFDRGEEYKQKAFDLAIKYKKSLESTVLVENKDPRSKQEEIEIINGLANLAMEMNNDDSQDEGVGSVGVITLILKLMLFQRDVLNKNSYDIDKLSKDVVTLSRLIKEKDSQIFSLMEELKKSK